MTKLKGYSIYLICFVFTVLGIYFLIESFTDSTFEKSEQNLFRERFINLAGILFFGSGGFVIYFSKKYPHLDNKPKLFSILFGCLGFIFMCLAIIIYPESFKKGPKIVKYTIGIIGLIFFGFGLILSLIKLIRYKR